MNEWISLHSTEDSDFLSLNFEKGLRENAVLWLLGLYVEVVEKEVVLKGSKLSISFMKGHFKQKKLMTKYLVLPEIGIIPGIDTVDAVGIGW